MLCPRCAHTAQENPHGDVSLFTCPNSECGTIFFAEKDIMDLLASFNATATPENIRLFRDYLFLNPYAENFRPLWQNLSDEELAIIANDGIETGFITFLAEKLISSLVPAEEIDNSIRPRLVEPACHLLALSLGSEICRRTDARHSPAAKLLTKMIRDKEALAPQEARDLARLGQFRPGGKTRHNPDAPESAEEENSSIFLVALLEQLKDDPIPTPFTTDGLLKVMKGCLNEYLKHADNKLRANLETLNRRSEINSQLDDTLPFPVEIISPPDKIILLMEINSVASDCLTEREKEVLTYCIQDVSQTEIAERLSISQGRVSQLYSRAITKIRNRLDPS